MSTLRMGDGLWLTEIERVFDFLMSMMYYGYGYDSVNQARHMSHHQSGIHQLPDLPSRRRR